MNILVTGANGQLGNEMRQIAKGYDHKYIFTDVVELPGEETVMLDITDMDSLRRIIHDNDINAIINCAAYTNVETAEENPALCELLNTQAPKNLALAMNEVNGFLVHISTDYVFGGDPYNTPCREEQKGTPTGIYGQTKLQGEIEIQKSGCDHVIIRTAWLYSEFGRNFVKTMLNLTSTKEELSVVFDQTGTPTYALDLATAIHTILSDYSSRTERPYVNNGVYNYSNEGVCSWFDFTKMIAEYSGNTRCNIKPCHSDEFPSKVKRPAYSVLDKTKIKETFGITVPYWTDSLKKCIENLMEA